MSVWAEAHVTLDVDGKGLPAATRKAAEKAANQIDKTFTKSLTNLGKDMAEQMHKNGLLSGDSFGEAMKGNVRKHAADMQNALARSVTVPGGMGTLRKNYASLDVMIKDVTDSLFDLNQSGEITEDQFYALGGELDKFAVSAREAEENTAKLAKQSAALKEEQAQVARNTRDLYAALGSGDGFKQYTKFAGDSTKATRELSSHIDDLEIVGDKTGFELSKLRTRLAELNDEMVEAERSAAALAVNVENVGDSTEQTRSRVGRLTDSLKSFLTTNDGTTRSLIDTDKAHQSLWKSLSANTRQWTLIIGAIAAGGTSIAALGSAAGAGLMVLGGAATSVIVGVGALIPVFKGLNGELADLPKEVRPAATAFQSIGKAFKDMGKEIQISALKDAAGDFESLRETVKGLTPAFKTVGDSIGRMIKSFSAGLAPGTRNFKNLSTVVERSGPIFEKVGTFIGTIGEALLEAFANPRMNTSIENMMTGVQNLADTFLNFTQSNGLTTWLDRADRVFTSLGGLLSATGTALNNLVDDEAVGRLTGFLDNLTRFMPHLENMLNVIGELDVFGLAAQMLADFGDALEPLAGPMEDLFAALNNIISIAIDEWADDFGRVAEELAPVTQAIADFLAEADEDDIRRVADALIALAAGALVLKGTAGLAGLGAVVKTNLGGLTKVMKNGDWKALGKGMGKGGAAAFLPALIAGLIGGEGSAGSTIATGAITGATFGGLPGAMAGALIGAIVSAFTDPGSWTNGWEQITTFFTEGIEGVFTGINWENGAQQLKDAATFTFEGVFDGVNWENGLTQINEGMQTWWAPDWENGRQQINDALNGLFGGVFEGVNWENGKTQISEGVGSWWTDLGLAFENGKTQINEGWSTFWNGLPAQTEGGKATTTGGVTGWWSGLMASFDNGRNQINSSWSTFWNGVPTQAANGQMTTTGGVVGWWAGLMGSFANGGNQIGATWSRFWNGLPAAASNGWNQITTGLGTFWNNLRGAFSNGASQISSAWSGLWNGLSGIANGVVNGITSMVRGMSSAISGAISGLKSLLGMGGGSAGGGAAGRGTNSGGGSGGMASGGIVTYGARRLIGEDGPEAVVPLNRPLSQVDPAVRHISAYAQGMTSQGGNSRSTGYGTYVAPGAISIVTPTESPLLVANMLLDRLVTQ